MPGKRNFNLLACNRLVAQKRRIPRRQMLMTTNRIIMVLAVALLCIAQGSMAQGEKKKSGGGSPAEHANKAVQLSQQGALEPAIAEFNLAMEESPKDTRL